MPNGLVVVSGNAHRPLAESICSQLGVTLGNALVSRFSEGEIRVQINENVRGRDVFVVQPTCPPVNDNLMELLVMIDALRRASAGRITAVIPYYGYARQDRKDQPRVPITAKLVANLLTTAGTNRVITVDLHAGQIQGFFDIPVDNLYAVNLFVDYVKGMTLKSDVVVVSPDVGGIKTARAYAKRMGAALAVVDKRRISPEETAVMNVMGNVAGKSVVLVDDIVATGSSLVEAAKALCDHGAAEVFATISHPVLSGPALERLSDSELKQLVVTDSIPLGADKQHRKIKVLTLAPLLAEAIRRIHEEESISELFTED